MEMLTQAPTVLGASTLLFVLSIKINTIHFLSLVLCTTLCITILATSVDQDNTKAYNYK